MPPPRKTSSSSIAEVRSLTADMEGQLSVQLGLLQGQTKNNWVNMLAESRTSGSVRPTS